MLSSEVIRFSLIGETEVFLTRKNALVTLYDVIAGIGIDETELTFLVHVPLISISISYA